MGVKLGCVLVEQLLGIFDLVAFGVIWRQSMQLSQNGL